MNWHDKEKCFRGIQGLTHIIPTRNDISEVPSNDKVDRRVYKHPDKHPLYSKFRGLVISGYFVYITPLYTLSDLFPSWYVCGTNSERSSWQYRLDISKGLSWVSRERENCLLFETHLHPILLLALLTMNLAELTDIISNQECEVTQTPFAP